MAATVDIRTAVREWARASAAGELQGLAWVDASADPDATPHTARRDDDGVQRFRHLPYAAFLPEAMADAMADAARAGDISAMEAVQMLFAEPEWLMVARPLLWSPLSPKPRLLAWLVERWGIESALHRDDPARLARIVARLPRWEPQRGRLAPAIEMTVEAAEEPLTAPVVDDSDGPVPDAPALRGEVFACRSDRWWARRRQPGATPAYRIEGGVVCHQPADGPVFELLREDVLMEWTVGLSGTRRLLRLLPAWASLRLALPTAPPSP